MAKKGLERCRSEGKLRTRPSRAMGSRNVQGPLVTRTMDPVENHKPTILIIDDEEQIRSLLIDLLGDTYHCSDAGSAEEALAALSRDTYDLVISDIDMGG